MSIPTKTKIILMQSIDPTTGEEYENVDEKELEVGVPTFDNARKDKSGRRIQLGTPATLIFPGSAIPANVREMAIAHLQALKQPDDSSVMAVAQGAVPIVKSIHSTPPRAGIPGWVSVTAAAAIFLGVTGAALAKSSLFRHAPNPTPAAAAAQPVAVPVVDLPSAAPIAEPEPVAIIVPPADLKPEPAVAPVPSPEPVAVAPKAAPVAAPTPAATHAHHAVATAPEPAPAPAPKPAKIAAPPPVAAPVVVAAKPARVAPTLKAAPAAAPAGAPANSEADELAKMQAAAKQQLGETLP